MIAVNKLVLFIIFLIILIAVIALLMLIGKPAIDQLLLQNEIRQCCAAYRANYCLNIDILCNSKILRDLINEIGMEQEELDKFCGCE